ncbi:hypothetical protein WJX84_009324 [Apatococcus fuscideae]|uniref:NAD-dependent epimerase/dehydratase domain-containing protein n=1 Tax=Apatococcus fuscideae TaxID=2026836 RepID=A0AAW1RE44_9CHLO
MKVFVTGGTGFIGSRVVDLLLAADHTVTCLVRDPSKAASLEGKGVHLAVGSLDSLSLLADQARNADATLHLAFIHDFTQFQKAVETEVKAVQAILEALKGGNKPFVITSGSSGVGLTSGPVDETHPMSPEFGQSRGLAEALMRKGSDLGVRTCVLRLPPYVYGKDGAAFSKLLETKCCEIGQALYFDSGNARAMCTYVDDIAKIYLLAMDRAPVGSVYNATRDSVTSKEIAEALARKHRLPLHSISTQEAIEMLGFPGLIMSMNSEVTSIKAEKELAWNPEGSSKFFLECLSDAQL